MKFEPITCTPPDSDFNVCEGYKRYTNNSKVKVRYQKND